MTPCEKLGCKVGDKFRVISLRTYIAYLNDILTLVKDDGSSSPIFIGSTRSDWINKEVAINLAYLEPINNNVNSPSHYNQGNIECIDAIKAALTPEEFEGFCKGNALKYIWRMNFKENKKQDMKKAIYYLNKIEEVL